LPTPEHTMSDCAGMLRVLGDQTRLAVVSQLFDHPLHVSEIQAQLGVEQSLLSHHLRVLRDAALVVAERDGKRVLYRVSRDVASRRSGGSLDFGCCRLTFNRTD